MASEIPESYQGREQALVKHDILQRYLSALAIKIGVGAAGTVTLNYVDAFAGFWANSDAEINESQIASTSPFLALRELLKAKSAVEKTKPFNVRAMFIEKDRARAQALERWLRTGPYKGSDIETHVIQGEFESRIDVVAKFCEQPDSTRFGFVFIDAKGWTGFSMDALTHLFAGQRWTEVLVNLMTVYAKRFVAAGGEARGPEHDMFGNPAWPQRENVRDSLFSLFGRHVTERELTEVDRRSGIEREEAIVDKKAMKLQEETRLAIREAARKQTEASSGQRRLGLESEPGVGEAAPQDKHYRVLRERALKRLEQDLPEWLQSRAQCTFEQIKTQFLPRALVWKDDLGEYLHELRHKGLVDYEPAPRAHRPHEDRTIIRWIGAAG